MPDFSAAFEELVRDMRAILDDYDRAKGRPTYAGLVEFYEHCQKSHSLPDICCPRPEEKP